MAICFVEGLRGIFQIVKLTELMGYRSAPSTEFMLFLASLLDARFVEPSPFSCWASLPASPFGAPFAQQYARRPDGFTQRSQSSVGTA